LIHATLYLQNQSSSNPLNLPQTISTTIIRQIYLEISLET